VTEGKEEPQTTTWKTSSVKRLERYMKYLQNHLILLYLITQINGSYCSFVSVVRYLATGSSSAALTFRNNDILNVGGCHTALSAIDENHPLEMLP
jgi:hypothetical protein